MRKARVANQAVQNVSCRKEAGSRGPRRRKKIAASAAAANKAPAAHHMALFRELILRSMAMPVKPAAGWGGDGDGGAALALIKRYPIRASVSISIRTFGRIAERGPQPVNGGIQPALEIHECIGRPEPGPQFFAADYLARLFEQRLKNVKWPSLQTYAHPVLAQFPGIQRNFKGAKSRREGIHAGPTHTRQRRAVGIDGRLMHTLPNRLSD